MKVDSARFRGYAYMLPENTPLSQMMNNKVFTALAIQKLNSTLDPTDTIKMPEKYYMETKWGAAEQYHAQKLLRENLTNAILKPCCSGDSRGILPISLTKQGLNGSGLTDNDGNAVKDLGVLSALEHYEKGFVVEE